MTPAITALETVHDGWAKMFVARVRTASGQEMRREIEHHGDAVAVLPYDPERRVATVIRQLRAPVLHQVGAGDIAEVAAGLLESDDPAECARREALEETGLALGQLELVATVWTMPGISTERMHLYLAPYGPADRQGPGGGLASEMEEVHAEEVSLAELARWSQDGRLADVKALVLLQALQLRRPDLFGAS